MDQILQMLCQFGLIVRILKRFTLLVLFKINIREVLALLALLFFNTTNRSFRFITKQNLIDLSKSIVEDSLFHLSIVRSMILRNKFVDCLPQSCTI